MTFEEMSIFARSWGLVYLMVLFVSVCAYAFWPRNKEKFDRAAKAPLERDEA